MSLVARVLAALDARGAKAALIGGNALAVHGVARATQDLDLLTTDASVLDATFASTAQASGDARRGDPDDPLVGVVRFTDGNEVVDLVVGGAAWMKGVVERASKHRLGSSELPVVEPADLVLLKLYAGGPQDLLDARLLIAARPEIRSVVEARVAALPRDARDAWERL